MAKASFNGKSAKLMIELFIINMVTRMLPRGDTLPYSY